MVSFLKITVCGRNRFLISLELVHCLPYGGKTNGGVELVEDGKRSGHVGDDAPRHRTVEVEGHRIGVRSKDLERIGRPDGDVADQQKGYVLASRFPRLLPQGPSATP